jgi:hypothetical protein
VAEGEGERGDLAGSIRDVVGAVGAVAALVIVPGSIALLLRLQRAHLPADLGVVSSLPSQFLLAIGLAYVAAPLLIVVALALVAVIAPGREHRANPALMTPIRRRGGADGASGPSRVPGAILLGLFSVVLIVGIPIAVYRPSPPPYGFVLSAFTILAWLAVSRLVAAKYSTGITSRPAVALLALVATGAFVSWSIAFAVHRVNFPEATVCTSQGTPFDGILIGQTADRVYLGEPEVNINVVASHPVIGSKIRGTLRGEGYGVHLLPRVASVSYRRTDLLIADLGSGLAGLSHVDRVGVPTLAYGSRDDLLADRADAAAAGVDRMVPIPGVTNPTRLVATVHGLLATERAPQRERKIASIASSQVTRVILGSTGPCQVPGGAAA